MQARNDPLPALKIALARHGAGARLDAAGPVPLGVIALDEALGGGLARGAVHECFAALGSGDAAAASGFGLGLALRFAGKRPLVWIRQDFVDEEAGRLYGAGLSAFGLDPDGLILVRVSDQAGGLRAAGEAARCPALGAVLVEFWGASKALDLTASRRLALAAEKSGVTLVIVRLGASPAPSAATSRWSVSAAPSCALEANAPGRPAFSITLLRHRAGIPSRTWSVEWDHDECSFSGPAPLSRSMVSVPASRKAAADEGPLWRRAG